MLCTKISNDKVHRAIEHGFFREGSLLLDKLHNSVCGFLNTIGPTIIASEIGIPHQKYCALLYVAEYGYSIKFRGLCHISQSYNS